MAHADGRLYSLAMNEASGSASPAAAAWSTGLSTESRTGIAIAADQTVFLDPKVAAVVLALVDGKLVLVRREMDPQIGRWAFPSGFVDRGEAVEDAAVREFKEETGLDARLETLIGVYSAAGSPVVLVVYKAAVIGGSLQAGHDATDAALFDPEQLPPLPFPHDDRILADWRALAKLES